MDDPQTSGHLAKDSGTKLLRRLNHDDYTVGWICAISCELTAALAALDEKHEALSNPLEDKNMYSYGAISGHNVVVSCLPEGIYGTTAATAVATRMLATFGSITIPLMVGIGGGVPSAENDIRLGDIVVSIPTPDCSAVIQYDYGKTVASGKFERKGSLNKPSLQLLAAVSIIRADVSCMTYKIPEIINIMLTHHQLAERGFAYPKDEDTLYEPGCEHVDELDICDICGHVGIVKRQPRVIPGASGDIHFSSKPSPLPEAHYGPIASGNQVMKNSRIRDKIARPLGILCFEMESAGLMDIFPCLVIRGISDYCDARKAKGFQKYAALVSAAYAKLLLTIVPPHEQRRFLAAKGHFSTVGVSPRIMAIRNASPDTCTWLKSHPAYLDWLNDNKLSAHHGILWIKGKPGAGKSTLMNFTRLQLEKKTTLINFFFNARGTKIEKTTSGMYRSLLSQLFKAFPTLYMSFDLSCLPSRHEEWSLPILQRLFATSITQLGQQSITCLIDALDESSEDDIRDMVEVFKELGELTASRATSFRVLWSSRYYPHISIEFGLEILLDKVEEHSQDLQKYIDQELPSENNRVMTEIKADILSKSAGIFLWVVLVIRLLRKEYDHGRIKAMRKTLDALPEKLADLFQDIVSRDQVNVDELVLCLQWILYSEWPLSGLEFYSAMMIGLEDEANSLVDLSHVNDDVVARYLTSSSKGLAELIYPKRKEHETLTTLGPRVQFIHESVREFLLPISSTQQLDSSFRDLAEVNSHGQIQKYCIRYLMYVRSKILSTYKGAHPYFTPGIDWKEFPLTYYALKAVLFHAEQVVKSSVSKDYPIDINIIDIWWCFSPTFHIIPNGHEPRTREGRFLCRLAFENYPFLLRLYRHRFCERNKSYYAQEYFDVPLYCALHCKSFNAIRILLGPLSINLDEDTLSQLFSTFSEAEWDLSTSCTAWMHGHGLQDLATGLRELRRGQKVI